MKTNKSTLTSLVCLAVLAMAHGLKAPARLRYRWWIAREIAGRLQPVVGPVDTPDPDARLAIPADPAADFFLLVVVPDDGDGICGTTLPFRTAE